MKQILKSLVYTLFIFFQDTKLNFLENPNIDNNKKSDDLENYKSTLNIN